MLIFFVEKMPVFREEIAMFKQGKTNRRWKHQADCTYHQIILIYSRDMDGVFIIRINFQFCGKALRRKKLSFLTIHLISQPEAFAQKCAVFDNAEIEMPRLEHLPWSEFVLWSYF